ncbi:phosphatase 2C (PP2C)-like protein [Corchorus capsularis]|uniref:Protein phosphatase n=1 Tax=Corchorus capsularis TaxID=210143 RepID=A0A1R3IB85_COCAP|nr:phosphatase 2C (PP2C)-like protein [Corchorus capsularis]
MADRVGAQKGNLMMLSGSFYISKERSSRPQGDDSHFICEEKQTIGLADGVGGWNSKGIDAGIYARELMNNALMAILTQPDRQVDPMTVLSEAYSKTKALGSSTACIITLKDDNMLHAVNMGDSGFMLIRGGVVIYKSPIQQHSFNFPYQLGYSSGNADRPSQAEVIKLGVEPGDVIIAGTDGLFDNLSEDQILEAAARGIEQGLDPEDVAWPVAQRAYNVSMDGQAVTPFMQASTLAGKRHTGGKQDDITVIVSRILDM